MKKKLIKHTSDLPEHFWQMIKVWLKNEVGEYKGVLEHICDSFIDDDGMPEFEMDKPWYSIDGKLHYAIPEGFHIELEYTIRCKEEVGI